MTDDESARSLSEIVAGLGSSDTGERFEATEELGIRGDASAAAVSALVAALRDPQLLVRMGAIKALGRIGTSAAAAAPALLLAMEQPEQLMHAAWALGTIGSAAPGVAARLRSLLDDADQEAREVAAMALWRIERHPAAVDVIGEALHSLDARLVATAARDLIEIGGRSAAARLEGVLTSGDEDRARIVRETIARLGVSPEVALRSLRDTPH
ncbi:MAG: HEAT repeat domain-containing protein [Acidobacteriota bacterium]